MVKVIHNLLNSWSDRDKNYLDSTNEDGILVPKGARTLAVTIFLYWSESQIHGYFHNSNFQVLVQYVNKTQNLVITVHADALAPDGVRTSPSHCWLQFIHVISSKFLLLSIISHVILLNGWHHSEWLMRSHKIYMLTHWGWDKMAITFQTTYSSAFCWMKTFES